MMKLGIIVVVVLLLLAAGGFAVYYFWFHQPEEHVAKPGEEVDVPVNEDADVLGDLSGPDPGAEPDFAFTEEGGSREIEPPVEEGTSGERASTEEVVDLSGETTETTGGSEEDLPIFPEETPVTEDMPVVEPADTPRPERTPESITVQAEPTATPKPPAVSETSAPTPTPAPEPTTQPAPSGNFSVKTLVPVMKSKLPAIRTAMKQIGVTLKEEKAGRQQRVQGYRVAIGYFRSQTEAKSWAANYLRPKDIDYFVYPARNMYSIQVGVYTKQRNVEKKVRSLYQKFPGWRLPVRTERYTFVKPTYHLSLRKIPESLGRKIQDALFRMGVQAELAGA